MSSYDQIQEAFEKAKREFEDGLKNPSLYAEILKTTTIDQVYDAADKLQDEQAKHGHLRHLAKIEPYLERLRAYTGVLETFVQASPEILSLIWGPIKLLLQWSGTLKQSFDAIVNTTAKIGEVLPQFQEVTRLFSGNDRIKDVLFLFFKDILDFYRIALEFFSKKRWRYLLESVWPTHKAKIDLVTGHIERHALLMRNEVSLEHIREEHEARIREFDHYEQTREFQERQYFSAVQIHISPRLYDNELDRLHINICEGTGLWLQKSQAFHKWLDFSDTSTNLVWLQGIPGSGKTYLTSTVVDTAKSLGLTLFALLSYKDSANTSTISILHSLIFQLATEDKDLQTVLWMSKQRDLKSCTKFASEVFSNLLKCAGPTYIIIDGLDEIAELDRRIFLHELLNILKDSDEIKLLISSRQEDDISRILEDNAQVIRVDNRNAGSIQAYINRSTQSWFQNVHFNAEAQSEIQGLLAPLAANAKGMFLYAKIVMDNISGLNDIESIRKELRVLPRDLKDAYDRIFARINDLRPLLRERARRLLGWIGCSPLPITRQEMEQALLIVPGKTDKVPQVDASLNILQLCGPIIEIFDDRLQFVHFTVKEYLFSREINFVDITQANLSLLITCLTYLSLDLFELDIPDEEMEENVLSGAYRLHGFATPQWVGLVTQYAMLSEKQILPDELVKQLDSVITERKNFEFEGQIKDNSKPRDLDIFERKWPKMRAYLCNALKFQRQRERTDWRMSESDAWVNLDPSTLSHSSDRIYQQFEKLFCPGSVHASSCHCSKLQRHYGARIFKCEFLACPFHRQGFETKSLRDTHIKHHSRPWKCTVPTCDFSVIGFLTRSNYHEHWLQCHQPTTSDENMPLDKLDDDEIQPLLFDLVKMDKLDEVNRLLLHFRQLPDEIQQELIKLAVSHGSLAMVQLLVQDAACYDLYSCAALASIESENIEVLNWVLPKTNFDSWDLGLKISLAVMRSGSAEVFEIWDKEFAIHRFNIDIMISERTMEAVSKNPAQEARLMALWKREARLGRLTRTSLGKKLSRLAQSSCSIVQAKALLDCGADINFRLSSLYLTPLHHAARKTTAKAAELMKFLLLSGADPTTSATSTYRGSERTTTISTERGARNISKWLNMTWDELVEWAQEERKKLSQSGGDSGAE